MLAKEDLYTATREEAANLLRVSTRTLDRYIRKGRLKSKVSPTRNILIHTEDLEKVAQSLFLKKSARSPKKRFSKSQQKAKTVEVKTEEVKTENVEERVFRNLYEEANKDLKSKQEKLEAASFRVGQLEAQLKNSVPLLEHKQKEQELSLQNSELKEKLIASKLKGRVFLGITFLIIAMTGALGFLVYTQLYAFA